MKVLSKFKQRRRLASIIMHRLNLGSSKYFAEYKWVFILCAKSMSEFMLSDPHILKHVVYIYCVVFCFLLCSKWWNEMYLCTCILRQMESFHCECGARYCPNNQDQECSDQNTLCSRFAYSKLKLHNWFLIKHIAAIFHWKSETILYSTIWVLPRIPPFRGT